MFAKYRLRKWMTTYRNDCSIKWCDRIRKPPSSGDHGVVTALSFTTIEDAVLGTAWSNAKRDHPYEIDTICDRDLKMGFVVTKKSASTEKGRSSSRIIYLLFPIRYPLRMMMMYMRRVFEGQRGKSNYELGGSTGYSWLYHDKNDDDDYDVSISNIELLMPETTNKVESRKTTIKPSTREWRIKTTHQQRFVSIGGGSTKGTPPWSWFAREW